MFRAALASIATAALVSISSSAIKFPPELAKGFEESMADARIHTAPVPLGPPPPTPMSYAQSEAVPRKLQVVPVRSIT